MSYNFFTSNMRATIHSEQQIHREVRHKLPTSVDHRTDPQKNQQFLLPVEQVISIEIGGFGVTLFSTEIPVQIRVISSPSRFRPIQVE